MISYSNSEFDLAQTNDSRRTDEANVRGMYERAPYPDLGAALKDLRLFFRVIQDHLRRRSKVRFLDAGCGTGHILVGVAKQNPTWDCFGIDLSGASLRVAEQLADRHATRVHLERGSYLDPLPFTGGAFDVISAMGTIHHATDPVGALRALRASLADDGWLLLHLYGWRCDQRKFDVKEALSLLEPDLENVVQRFRLYDALVRHEQRRWLRRLAKASPELVYSKVRTWFRNLGRRAQQQSWSPPWTDRFRSPSAPWIDHFCHPCERAYEVPDVRKLVEAGGFRVVHNLRQGIEHPQLIPPEWQGPYDRLSDWEKWRMSELLADGGGSFALSLQKASASA